MSNLETATFLMEELVDGKRTGRECVGILDKEPNGVYSFGLVPVKRKDLNGPALPDMGFSPIPCVQTFSFDEVRKAFVPGGVVKIVDPNGVTKMEFAIGEAKCLKNRVMQWGAGHSAVSQKSDVQLVSKEVTGWKRDL